MHKLLYFGINIFCMFFLVSAAQAICVSSSTANLRAGPSTKSKITWTVAKYTPLIELSRRGGWVEVQDMDGQKHWVHGSALSNKFICVSVRVPVARVRTSPNGEVADIRQLDRYTPLKRIDINGEWYEVESGWGPTYWIHESTVWRPVRVSNVNF